MPLRFTVLLELDERVLPDVVATARSVAAQSRPGWELLLLAASSPSGAARDALSAVLADDRVRLVEGRVPGRAAAWVEGVAAAAGEACVLLVPGQRLVPEALDTLGAALRPEVDLVYGDSVEVDGDRRRRVSRPVWSPERLRGHLYTGPTVVVRTDLLRATGGPDLALDGAERHDLVLRLAEHAHEVVQVPVVLDVTPARPALAGDGRADAAAWRHGRTAVQAHLDRAGVGPAWVALGPTPGTYRVVRHAPPGTRVSVVIPTRGGQGLVWGQARCFVVEAVASLLATGGHGDLEVVVVHDDVTPPEVLDELRRVAGRRLVLVPFSGPFNFSAKCNLGFLASSGDVVVFLNDDVEARATGWLDRLVGPLADPTVGMTGARLLYADGTVQHGAHVYDSGSMHHAFLGVPPDDPDATPVELQVNREASGLTAACVALTRQTYEDVGGMCEALPVNFNDVDLSWKVRHRGRRLLWLADVELYHFESRTRVPVVHAWEVDQITGRWPVHGEDPYLPRRADVSLPGPRG